MAFYLTLPSNASSGIFPENTPGTYTVQLPKTIFIPEGDWEVALASIYLPDMAPVVDSYTVKGKPIYAQAMFFAQTLEDDGETLKPIHPIIDTGTVDVSDPSNIRRIFMWSKDKKAGDHSRYYWDQIVSHVELDLNGDSIVFTGTRQSGYEVWARLVNMLSKSLHDHAKSIVNYPEFRKSVEKNYVIDPAGESVTEVRNHIKDWTNADGTSKLPVFEWRRVADTFELTINNKGVRYKDDYNVFYLIRDPLVHQLDDVLNELTQWFCEENYVDIELGMAKKFHMVEETERVDPSIGQKIKALILSSSVRIEHFRDHNLKRWSNNNLWKTVTRHGQSYVRFYSYVNWHFSGLNQQIYEATFDPNRTLYVYTDLAETQIVGASETDLLREVVFKINQGGKYLFEPINLQYLPIRKNVFDTVEVGISETDGTQVNFAKGPTILTVHFRRRGVEVEK